VTCTPRARQLTREKGKKREAERSAILTERWKEKESLRVFPSPRERKKKRKKRKKERLMTMIG